MQLSVVIPAHNPDPGRLKRTLAGLRAQTMPPGEWETVLIDNASTRPLATDTLAAVAPANFRIVREEALGLTPARLRGFAVTTGRVIVLVDDDNVLAPDFLHHVLAIAAEHPRIGAWSGNVVLEFEPDAVPPPPEWRCALTERLVTVDTISSDRNHHDSTPWGAGFCLRREVAEAYAVELARNPLRRQLDLHGETLLYGGDTDIAFVACATGYTKGVFARLTLRHLIPARRCEESYLLRSIEAHAYSCVLHEFILSGSIPPYFSSRRWRLRQWLRRLTLPRAARLEAAHRVRGYAQGAAAVRRMQATA